MALCTFMPLIRVVVLVRLCEAVSLFGAGDE